MTTNLNSYGQTRQWENTYIKTRRNIEARKKRLSKFTINHTDKVLDVGCGDGLNIKILSDMGVQNVIGVDISKSLLTLAKKSNPHHKFYLASVEKLPFKKINLMLC